MPIALRTPDAESVLTDWKTYSAAHELRRTWAQDMMGAECDEADIMRVKRRADWESVRNRYALKRVEMSAGDRRSKRRRPPSQNDPHSGKSQST